MTFFNINIWIFLAIIAVIALMFSWKTKNAIWGGLTIGGIIGLIIAIVFLLIGKGFHWSFIQKGMILGTLVGVIAEFLAKFSSFLKNRHKKTEDVFISNVVESKVKWEGLVDFEQGLESKFNRAKLSYKMNSSFLKHNIEVDLADLCEDFYENNIFPEKGIGVDFVRIFYDTVKKSIVDADRSFDNIPSQKFITEMTTIRLEVFATAWIHQFGDKLAILHGIVTKDYLEKKNLQSFWVESVPYNQAVAKSCDYEKNSNSATDRGQIGFTDSMRMQLFNDYYDKGYDPECIARTINRHSTETAWNKGMTAGFLTLALCSQLNCEINEEAMFRLTAIIRGFYDGAKEYLSDINVRK